MKESEEKIKTLSDNLTKKEREAEDGSRAECKNAEDRQKEIEEHQNEMENMKEQLR